MITQTLRKGSFSRFLGADPDRLHFAAHSHHPWPDVSFEAQQRAWLDAAELMDTKWERIFGEVVPAAQEHVRRILNLPDAATVAFAPNTHELVKRVVSGLDPDGPLRILTTDSEFHAFERQTRRWEEAGQAAVERVPTEPFATFADRFRARARAGEHHLVYVSHVFFNSGWVFEELADVVDDVPESACVIVDGYHAFCALPADVSRIASRAFYTGGGYKYAMAGEGACFLHCPPGRVPRPVDTGWFAGFGVMEEKIRGVPYPQDGQRFLGSTLDATGLYRLRAVQDFWQREGVGPGHVHAHSRALQDEFLRGLDAAAPAGLTADDLVPPREGTARGNFLTFRTESAGALYARLRERGVIVDRRDDRIRFGFGIYQDEADVAALLERLADA
ncbi:MAG TPA: aminotransferase class V-fold PLP-dependent enzyme [bacterium]|nr:aminotransferase class V-fold PLP-dependent enzyme [bacterium]